jgi:hypothetical protein
MPPLHYRNWLSHVFDHPVRDPAWFFELDVPAFDVPADELVELITHAMLNCGNDLKPFSDGQVNDGLNYIFNNSCSSVVFAMLDNKVPLEKRRRAIASIKRLYADCFEPRCAPVLGHKNQQGGNPLNYICYMLWDVSPLAHLDGQEQSDLLYETLLDVLESALDSKNIACVESALHGLGHIQHYRDELSRPMIQRFIHSHPQLKKDIRQYAENAASGCIL